MGSSIGCKNSAQPQHTFSSFSDFAAHSVAFHSFLSPYICWYFGPFLNAFSYQLRSWDLAVVEPSVTGLHHLKPVVLGTGQGPDTASSYRGFLAAKTFPGPL